MNAKESLERIIKDADDYASEYYPTSDYEDRDVVRSALQRLDELVDRERSTKPYVAPPTYQICCGKCRKPLIKPELENYCPYCGYKVDWS